MDDDVSFDLLRQINFVQILIINQSLYIATSTLTSLSSFLPSAAMSFLTNIRRAPQLLQLPARASQFHRSAYSQSAFKMAANLDSENISKITDAEKKISGSDEPMQGGPTAQAQKNAGQPINSQTLSDITEGEKKITGADGPVKGGPTATAQSILTQVNLMCIVQYYHMAKHYSQDSQSNNQRGGNHTGKLDAETISKITDAEKDITGSDDPARGGPTAQAQKHVGETIGSQNLHDITEGEKKITGGERLKGGPTSTAQSELAQSRK